MTRLGQNTFATSQSVEGLLRSWLPVARGPEQGARRSDQPRAEHHRPDGGRHDDHLGGGFARRATDDRAAQRSRRTCYGDRRPERRVPVTVTIPAGTTPGTHQIVVSGLGPDGQPRESCHDRGAGLRRSIGRRCHGRTGRERPAGIHRMKRVARVWSRRCARCGCRDRCGTRLVATAAGDSTAVVVIDTGTATPACRHSLRRQHQWHRRASNWCEPRDAGSQDKVQRCVPRWSGQPGRPVVLIGPHGEYWRTTSHDGSTGWAARLRMHDDGARWRRRGLRYGTGAAPRRGRFLHVGCGPPGARAAIG